MIDFLLKDMRGLLEIIGAAAVIGLMMGLFSKRQPPSLYVLARLFLILAIPAYIACAVLAALLLPPWAAILLGLLVFSVCVKNRRRVFSFTTQGSAAWADESELRRHRMIEGRGLILGQLMDVKISVLAGIISLLTLKTPAKGACLKFFAKKRSAPFVHMPPEVVHTALFAPAGAGKSTGLVIPFLLMNSASAVVIDLKGELTRATAEARRRMGHHVVILDPYQVVTSNPDTLNPLDFVEKDSDDALDHCDDIAQALVVRNAEEKEQHWLDSAQDFISGFTAAIVKYAVAEKRSLQQTADALASPQKVDWMIERMVKSDAWEGLLARRGGQLAHRIDKEKASVLSTVARFTRFLNTPAMARSTARSSFDPRYLKRSLMTVFLVLPPEHLRSQSGWLRLMITTLLRAVVSQGVSE